jgi:8-hydroxy-5-deazaflavin:NADPH oxidoreductase
VLLAALLAADVHEDDGRRVLVLSGNDDEAKSAVAELFESAGFSTIDVRGHVAGGRLQQAPGGVFPTRNLLQLGEAA